MSPDELTYSPKDLIAYANVLRATARAWLQDMAHDEAQKKILHDANQQAADFIEGIAQSAIERDVIVQY